MKVQHTSPQLEEICAHVQEHQNVYILGAGIVIGALGARLFGRAPVVIIHNAVQGAPCG